MLEKQEVTLVSPDRSASDLSAPQLSPTYNRFALYSIPLLWGATIALLILNLISFYGLNQARLAAIEALGEVEMTLDNLTGTKIAYDIEVDESVPVQADVPLSYMANVPIDLLIPIDQSMEVPIKAPTGEEFKAEVPLKTEFPVNEMIPININEATRVDTIVPLNATVPIEIDVAQTPLADYLEQAMLDIAQLKERLSFK